MSKKYANNNVSETKNSPLHSAPELTLDHVVISVSDLHKAVSDFRSLGFLVEYGGKNGPVHNALICFQDGSYIELISPINRLTKWLFRGLYLSGLLKFLYFLKPTLLQRFFFWFGGPNGICDWCIACTDLEQISVKFQAKGISMTSSKDFHRTRQDGIVASWQLAAPENRALPFIIEDVSSIDVRVPLTDATEHNNKVSGIFAVSLQNKSAKALSAYLPSLFNNIVSRLNNTGEQLIKTDITTKPSAPAITLELKTSAAQKGKLPLNLTSGAHIVFV